MASSNEDKTMENDTEMHKKPEKPKTNLIKCFNEFQEKLNEAQLPPPPWINSAHTHKQPELGYNILDEIRHVYQLIKDNGQQGEYAMQMKFGELIPLYGTDQVDKLVEILANARKNRYINYTLNDFLRQDRDENICIRLTKAPY